jgi:murein L,D-transpeptidase YafK
MASAALAAAIALAGCDTDGTPSVGGRHMQPLSERMIADIEKKNMEKESPILVRIFKEEAELEVWKEDKSGRFALLRTYPICRWSGELGPKIKEGDRQAPEGFYTITPGLMNPNSQYHLAINMGFPNAYDRSHGRTGGFLMIHGDCSSRGCYAMTDEQISEIYALARESFFGGQKSFQVQAYPFRMTPINMAKHRNSPHVAFWKMLKEGYDHFEVSRLEPKVDVCEKRYVFGAEASGKFSASDRCPAYKVPEDIVAAVRDKQRRDDIRTAELISRGTPTVPVRMGVDGGMNQTFLSAVKSHGGPGATIRTAAGTIPPHVNPPGESSETPTGSTMSLASAESKPVSAPRSTVQVASAGPVGSSGIGGFFSNLFGSKGEEQSAELRGSQPVGTPKSKSAPSKPTQTAAANGAIRPKSEPETKTANAAATKPQASPPKQHASAEPQGKPDSINGLLNGAAPTMPSGGFDNRFGAWR